MSSFRFEKLSAIGIRIAAAAGVAAPIAVSSAVTPNMTKGNQRAFPPISLSPWPTIVDVAVAGGDRADRCAHQREEEAQGESAFDVRDRLPKSVGPTRVAATIAAMPIWSLLIVPIRKTAARTTSAMIAEVVLKSARAARRRMWRRPPDELRGRHKARAEPPKILTVPLMLQPSYESSNPLHRG